MTNSERSKAFKAFIDAHEGDVYIRPTGARKSKKRSAAPYSIRFDEQERMRLNRDAEGRSWAAYIRSKLFPEVDQPKHRQTRKRRTPDVDQAALAQALGTLGQSHLASNLNQIAKAANLGTLPVTPELEEDLAEACADIQEMREALMKALGLIKTEDES